MNELTQYHERIAYLIGTTKGMSQSELARRLGISQQSINHLATKAKGSTHNSKIAQIFGVSPVWLETGKGPKEQSITLQNGSYQCPIIEWDELVIGVQGNSDVIEYLPVSTDFGAEVIGARYFGKTMSPPVTNGSYVIINYGDKAIADSIKNAAKREYNLVVVQKSDEILLRNLTKEGSELHLATTFSNETGTKLDLSTSKILGKVVFTLFRMD